MLYLLLIFFPVAMALSSFVLRRNTGLVIFAALGTVLTMLLIAMQIPLDEPARFLGVPLILNPLNRLFMLLFLAVGGLAFVAAWHLPHGENFVPIALLTLAEVCALLLLQNPFILTLLLVATGMTAVLAIVDLPAGASSLVGTRAIAAALKYLVLMVVAGVLMYIAFVLNDIYRPGELPERISPARFILALLAVSFALRLALIPFHTWLTDLVDHAEPLVSALIITLLNTTSLLVLVLVFQSFPTLLLESEEALTVLRIGALGSVLLGGWLALGPATLRRTLAYLILYSCGMVFYGLASVSSLGLAGAIFGSLNQTLAVMLLFVSLGLLERPGGLALLGLPPLNGAMSHLLIYQAAAANGWAELLPLLLGTLLAGLGLARAAAASLLGRSEEQASAAPAMLGETELDRPAARRLAPEPRSTAAVTLTLVAICLTIGLFPQPLLATIGEAIRGLAFLQAL
jgi:formate hydrogenlyase subunit 3/multisubunit Na+/H+ antiporter MnhD subunit